MFPRLSRLCQGSLSVFISTQFISAGAGLTQHKARAERMQHSVQRERESKETKLVLSAVHKHTYFTYLSINGLFTITD